ncbi:protein SODIUM POTASSIUM ROOT DEFECTIVE 1-like isoform X2 [Coffea eugenioides]|uniref:Uncharacterized protein isoform X2 n=1 Tax=Coffea arabica TaxID=13443 RepID=A0A6P6T1P4_COFAR|nr:protein SODIUM POTASSIUM ROOT DEFECTIVE 1-like isoform X2 [Coffea arabica]XP_027177308.1 protein SODIUM POTASSIUM ROOT DEFECTIVE 1-like isoform X2 [Coffea eugenioides]
MKGIDIFCASHAATSISCLSMDDPSSSSTIHLGGSGRAIDRYNPIIRDPRRFGGGGGGGGSSSRTLPHVPSCSSQTPINPKPSSHSHQQTPYPHHQNKNGTLSAMSSSSKPRNEKSHGKSTNTKKKFKMNNSNRSSSAAIKPPSPNDEEKKKSSGSIKPASSVHEPSDFRSSTSSSSSFGNRKSWSCSSTKAPAGDFISPPGSSRYLLSDQASFFNLITEDFDPLNKLLPPVVEAEPPVNHSKPSNSDDNNSKALQKDDQSKSRSPDQVVVLRVSLHCRGCERKMRKHISRMEGIWWLL